MKYTDALIKYIRRVAKGRFNKEICELVFKKFGITLTPDQMKNIKGNHNISSGLTGQFEKGHVPFNKGKKTGGWKPTYFQKGHIPPNTRPVGTERIDSKDGYLSVKIAEPNKWKAKHVIIWEEQHGKVPEGHKVIFLDGNKTNIELDNLAIVTYGQMLLLNQHRLIKPNPEITKTGLLLSSVMVKAHKLKRGQNDKTKKA